jgi:hypothetical protein
MNAPEGLSALSQAQPSSPLWSIYQVMMIIYSGDVTSASWIKINFIMFMAVFRMEDQFI